MLIVGLTGCGTDGTAGQQAPSPTSTTSSPDPATTTVPGFQYGTSVEDVLDLLETAGLKGDVPDVDFPHYATHTDPPAGRTVPIGSTVTVRIGDG